MRLNYKKNKISGFTPLNPTKSVLAPRNLLRNPKGFRGASNLTGFSLIEIMVVMGISSVLIFMSADFIIQGFRSSAFIYEQNMAVQNARRAQDIMVKEIRKINRAENGEYLLDTVLPQTFTFYSDVDSDGLTEKVRYFLDNSNLKKGLTHATGSPIGYPAENEKVSILSNYINNQTNPIFSYYDKNNLLIANPTSNKQGVRLIEISAKINVAPERAPKDFNVEADVQIRNLKDNL